MTTARENTPSEQVSLPTCWRGVALTPPDGYVFGEDIRPWNWAELDPEDAERLWGYLIGFVAYFNARYGERPDRRIVPCWVEHGPIVEELTTLAFSRWHAFESPVASIAHAQQWHAYALPTFLDRMRDWLASDLLTCQQGRHRFGSNDRSTIENWSVRSEILAILEVAQRRSSHPQGTRDIASIEPLEAPDPDPALEEGAR